MKPSVLSILLASVLILQPACELQSGAPPRPGVALDLPKWTGEFAVGRQFVNLADETRSENGVKREFAAWIYYPAKSSGRREPELILPQQALRDRYRPLLERKLGAAAATAMISLKTPAETDAPVFNAPNGFPVLLFAPGAGWLPTDYSALIEDVTSHGFVIVAFASSPLSPIVQAGEGRFIEGGKVDETTYGIIGADFMFLRSRLESLNQNPNLQIKGKLDLSRIGAFGHSIGGAAAVLAASRDGRIRASANLDGDFVGEALNSAPVGPVLYITTQPRYLDDAPIEKWEEDRNETRRKGIWEKVRAGSNAAFRVRIAKMFHANFQDAALLPPASMAEHLRKNRFGPIDGARGVALSAELIGGFFAAQFQSRPIAEFLAIQQRFAETMFEVK